MAAPEQNVDLFKGKPRLPSFAVPRRYDIRLTPNLAACTFAGAVSVAVDIAEPTRFLVLNANDLTVDEGSVHFSAPGSNELRPVEIISVVDDEILILRFDSVLPLGEGSLSIHFDGNLNDQLKGFYRSVCEHNGEKKNIAVTQFEPADARRCFPCWDEPAFKATFKITLEVPSDTVALSNMPVVEEKHDGTVKVLSFQESPIMSTYLVAVIVGYFDYVEAATSDGINVRVFSQPGKSEQGKFALDVAVKTLDLYKEYFAVPYPLPKLDMVAIPDFAAGAMENYGLVTYRETALLFDERHSAASNKQRVTTVVAHELAHQWFGNLVTMEWWTHLWLNEGFATWVSYLAAESIFPEWNVWTQFLDDATAGLRLDALAESHPIEVEVNHVDEIDEIFDAISYRKGAAIIRMLQSYLGAGSFQKALATYIKRFAYANAKTEDLWAALEEESGEPVNSLMSTWTKQMGYPVISANIRDGKLELEQTQFLANGSSGVGQWIVPITLSCSSYANQQKFLFKEKSQHLDLTQFSDPSKDGKFWLKLNVDQTGFYRVKYDEELAAGLRYAIETKQLTASDRYGVLDDSFALCMARKQTLTSLLSLISAYREESEYTVLSYIISISRKIVVLIHDAVPDLLDEARHFLIGFFEPFAKKLGWDPVNGEGHLNAMLRGELLSALVDLGHGATIDEAIRRFKIFLDDRGTPLLHPDVRKAAYLSAMKKTNSSEKHLYEGLLRIYSESELSQEKTRVLSSLASCGDTEVVHEVLDFLISSKVRNQDSVFGLMGVTYEGRAVAWSWFKEKWEYISKTFTGHLLTNAINAVVSPMSSDELCNEVEEFFATRKLPTIARTLKQSVERVQINTRWVESIKQEASLPQVLKELSQKRG